MQRPYLLIAAAAVALLVAGFLFVTLRPGPAPDALTRREPYCVSGDESVDELHIPSGAKCEFDPERDSTLRIADGSVLVEGVLRMRPATRDVTHKIVFENVDESGFEGSGMGRSQSGRVGFGSFDNIGRLRNLTVTGIESAG